MATVLKIEVTEAHLVCGTGIGSLIFCELAFIDHPWIDRESIMLRDDGSVRLDFHILLTHPFDTEDKRARKNKAPKETNCPLYAAYLTVNQVSEIKIDGNPDEALFILDDLEYEDHKLQVKLNGVSYSLALSGSAWLVLEVTDQPSAVEHRRNYILGIHSREMKPLNTQSSNGEA